MSLTKSLPQNQPEIQSMTNPGELNVVDHAERERALDTSRSFIVRAPAGSGKTRLLIQRYLALLARVEEPEEIVAITFTRKAAAEMRQRVMDAFISTNEPAVTDDVTQRLAAAVLARDAERGWQILSHPSRLRMQTIDSLNASITRQMPLLARFGAQPESVDDASALYREAAHELLGRVNDGDEVAADVATLLTHLDNNMAVTGSLLADVLRSRDHWLRNLRQMHERETLEATLARVRALSAATVAAAFPHEMKDETLALARIAGQNMAEELMDIGPSVFDELAEFPGANALALPTWLALADLLLTKEGAWRKRVDKRQGFPTSASKEEKLRLTAQKSRMTTLLQALADMDAELPAADTAAATLHGLRNLPAAAYTENQWRVLGAIVRLLPHATAMLWRVFGQHGQCDFTEIGAAASRALGQDDAPTDLALALDYRISHLLVDEFQDTSFAQFELLEKLTRGWSEGDGRTLFLVGDPMQSIYRFREAEVSLFSRAWREGVGGVGLYPLTLRVNFRSEPGIVEWVNRSFELLMPEEENASVGAVPYSHSVAFAANRTEAGPALPQPAVEVHSLHKRPVDAEDDEAAPSIDEQEAQRIVDIIASTRIEKPEATIAILVRNRGHLREIVPALKAANIDYLAVDIDPLRTRPIVQDLISLTRALLHPADRIAWFAMLRAPWCGLTLADLTNLADGANPIDSTLKPDERTVWELLNDATRVAALSADGQSRAARLRDVLAPAIAQRRRMPLREAVESTWLALHGPACLLDENDLCDVAMLFDLLESEIEAQASGGQLVDVDALLNRVDKLYAGKPNKHDMLDRPAVQIMTIHKAKGLEFDTVIVPGLHRPPRRDDKKLMVWTEQPNAESGHRELLLAPVRETGA
ncbi:MAG: UvrD-helicase domain-containing protein, partial [Betaproteobacteria bacterium]